MAVSVGVTAAVELFGEPVAELALPRGIWFAHAEVVGDGSGGDAVLQVTPPNAAYAGLYLWSLEDFSFRRNLAGGSGQAVQITVSTQELVGGGAQMEWCRTLDLNGNVSATNNAMLDDSVVRRGPELIWWPRGIWAVSLRLINQANTAQYLADWWGYLWDREARRRSGGPRRP